MNWDDSGLRAKLEKIKSNVPTARKSAAVSVLQDAQLTIKQGGNGWPPFKRLPKRPHNLLFDSGQLLQSLQVGAANNIFETSGDTTTVGSNLVYAAAQNFGNPDRNLPARPYLVSNDTVTIHAAQAFIKALLRGVA